MISVKQLTPIFIFMLSAILMNGQEEATTEVKLTNEASINSEFLEYSPAFYEDGIIFISSRIANKKYKIRDKRINKNIMSIFFAQRSEAGLLQTPVPFSEDLLSTVHEGPTAVDRTADNIFFTRNNLKKGKPKKAKDGIVKLKIYSSEKVGEKWGNIKELPFNNDEYNTAHPSVSVEGNYLYFTSDRPGGMGGMDIWRSRRIGDDWGDPENLGPLVNTEGDEIFPFIHADGTLYFASSGHSGFGGLDLYTTLEKDQQWTEVKNLGKPFNTEGDDFGFIIDRDKKNGYFSSSRGGGLGEDDIYSFYLLNNLDQITGLDPNDGDDARSIAITVIDDETGAPVEGANINYILVDELSLARALVDSEGNEVDPTTNELLLKLPFGEGATKGLTDSEGTYPADVSFSNYIFNIEKSGYQSRQVILTSTSEENEFLITLVKASDAMAGTGGNNSGSNSGTPDPIVIGDDGSGIDIGATIKEGTIIELPNIYYNFNDASIRPDARQDLDVVVGLMSRYPDMQIELASHTDSRGGTRYNKSLSQKRAQNAVEYLIRNGVSASRLRPTGYGEAELRNQCSDGVDCSEADHQYNRRTEVRVTSMSREINVTFVNSNNAPNTIDYSAENTSSSSSSSSSSNDSNSSSSSNANNSSSDSAVSISGDGGSVSVIVGVFRELKNAQKRLRQVIQLGFDKAEISDRNDKHIVVAGRYSEKARAKSAADYLNENSIKTYIKD